MKKSQLFILISLLVLLIASISSHFNGNRASGCNKDTANIPSDVRRAMQEGFNEANKSLPRAYGSLGCLEKISLNNDTIEYCFRVTGDSAINEFYESNIDDLKLILCNMFVVMDGRRNYGTQFATMMKEYGVYLKFCLSVPGDKIFTIAFNPDEPYTYLQKVHQSPAQAYSNMLKQELFLLKMSLPISIDSMQLNLLQTSPALAVHANPLYDSSDILVAIQEYENTVSFKYLVSDADNNIKLLKQNYGTELLANLIDALAEDADMKELLVTMAL